MMPALLRVRYFVGGAEFVVRYVGTAISGCAVGREAAVRHSATKKLDSQGGQAASAANELAAGYGAGLATHRRQRDRRDQLGGRPFRGHATAERLRDVPAGRGLMFPTALLE